MKLFNLTGQKFGKLTVIRQGLGKMIGKRNPKKRITWICSCDCGNEIEVLGMNLKHHLNTRSCGCIKKTSIKYNSVDLIGKTFGLLTVIRKTDKMTKTRGVIWECLCECGNKAEICTNGLTGYNNVTCGNKKHARKSKYVGEIPIAHIHTVKFNAFKRNIPYLLDDLYLWELFLKQDRKCALSGIRLFFTKSKNAWAGRARETTASLDRIDSSLGYVNGNVQWVDKDINKMKRSWTNKDFIELCCKICKNCS